jgi:signal peptidase II
MRKAARLGLVTVLLLSCVGCDQVTKQLVRTHLTLGATQSYLHDTLRLTYTHNTGAFLSLGDSLPKTARVAIFQGVVSLLVLGLIGAALFLRRLDRWRVVGVALIGASGLGNLIDRFVYDGHVTDFLNLGVGSVRTGIFNVADVAGVAGVILLLFQKAGR